MECLKRLLCVIIVVGGLQNVFGACPVGGPSFFGTSGGATRTPVWRQCITLPTITSNNFAMTVSSPNALTNYTIIWGDATANSTGASLAAGATVAHTYTTLGQFTIRILSDVMPGPCKDTVYGTILNLRPVSASINPLPSGQNVGCAPHTISFQDSTQNALPGTTLLWDFGDGTTVTRTYTQANTPISHIYASGSLPNCTTTVQLTANNTNCTIGPSTYSVSPILIMDKDQAQIGVPTNLCDTGRTYTFTDNSVINCPPLHSFRIVRWDFGDGSPKVGWVNGSTLTSVTHTFPSIGSYTITLEDSNDCGRSVITATITINTPPKPGFTATPIRGCAPLLVTVVDTSTGSGNSRTWAFPSGTPTTAGNVTTTSTTYNAAGTYTITLTVGNACATGKTATKTITVFQKPTAGITGAVNGCSPVTANLRDNSTNTTTNATYFWNFGNGQTSTAKNPGNTVFTIAGTYTVKLVVTDTCGKDSTTRTIRVDSIPTAHYTKDVVCKGDSTSFDASTSIKNTADVLSYKWYFLPAPVDSNLTTVTAKYPYTKAGFSYTSVLKVTTNRGCFDFDTQTVSVNVSPSLVLSTLPSTICDTIVSFSADTSGSILPITKLRWTFGAIPTDTGYRKDTVYKYASPGTYTAILRATNTGGCITTKTTSVTVNPIPDARPTGVLTCKGLSTQFRDSSTVGFSNTINQWFWDFNNDGVTDSTTQNPTFKYAAAGTYKVKLRVRSNNGCFNTDSVSVTVNPTPTATIAGSAASLCKKDTFTFTNTSTGATSYYWTFGDGKDSTVSSLSAMKKSYADSGHFAVKMVATSALGCKDSMSLNVVSNPWPAANFTVNDTIGCAPKLFQFTNTSVLANSYKWQVNGLTTSTATNRPDTTIIQTGQTVLIGLIATNSFGCRPDTARKTIRTFSNPLPAFVQSADSGCGPLNVSFLNTSIGGNSYLWKLGNGNTAVSVDASSVYLPSALNDSIYTVKLIVSNGPGCSDSISKTVRVFPKPISSFLQDKTDGCGPLGVAFTNTSVHKFGGTITDLGFSWNFGNGSTSSVKDPQNTYVASAIQDTTHTISLIVTSKYGCKDTSYGGVRIYPNATSKFTPDRLSGCGPLFVNFSNQSIPNDTGNISMMTFAWNFDNGNTSTSTITSNTFVANATMDTTYDVRLIAFSEHGCADTSFKQIRVYPNPLSSFTPSDTTDCGPATIYFTNNSIPHDTGSIAIMNFIWDYGNGFSSVAMQSYALYQAAPLIDTVYTVELIAFSEHGCTDTSYKNIRIHPKPVAAFTQDKTLGCGPLAVQFTNTSQLDSIYYWKFGDGDTSVAENPSHSFVSYPLFDSVYNIKFVVTSAFGCKSDTALGFVTARYNPQADFAPSRDSICSGESITFFNLSTGGIGYNWDLGNGQTSTTINPVASYVGLPSTDSVYSIRMVTSTPYGCRDTAIKTIRVTPPPHVTIFSNVPEICKLDSFTYNNQTTGGASYYWRFGDGFDYTTNALDSFKKAYLDSGQYNVRMVATSSNGCRDTGTFSVTVRPFPVARFTVNDTAGCAPKNFTFNNTSLISNNYKWLVNTTANTTATNRPDTLVQLAGQTFQVKLVAFNSFGCRPDTAVKTMYTFANPVPNFTISADSGCGPLAETFTNTTTGGATYQWHLGNGINVNSVNAVTQYTASNTADTSYTIQLIAYSGNGCSDSISKQVKVIPTPVANFTIDDTAGCGPLPVNFTNTSIHRYGGTINNMTFSWNFANGDTSSTKDASSVFTASRIQDTIYRVKLVGTSRFGCKDSITKNVRVYPNATARFNPNTTAGCGPLGVSFTNISTPNDTGSIAIMTFAWNLANGNTSTLQNPSTTFVSNPTKDTTYTIRLIAFSEHGCPDTAYKDVRVYPKPLARFTPSDTAGCVPLNVTFNNTSIPYDTGSIAIMSFVWDLGNGFNSINQDPSSQYLSMPTGDTTYTIRLIASSEHGCKDTAQKSVRVHPKPIIGFTQDKIQGCGPLTVQFTNTTQLGSAYRWSFGDGDTSNSLSPSHTFRSYQLIDSVYFVKLSATSAFGCKSDTAISNVIARYQPVAAFIPSVDSSCGNSNVIFSNLSNGAVVNAWNFGNGLTSGGFNPATSFVASATQDTIYNIRLVVTSPFQCRDTAYRTVKINFIPDASFASVTPGCTPLSVLFNNQSQRAVKYEWDFGDASAIDSTANPSKLFVNDLGVMDRKFIVTLKAISASGCQDTAKRNVIVFPNATARFNVNKDDGCGPLGVNFTNISVPNDTGSINIMTFAWDFANGVTSTQRNPSVTFSNNPVKDTLYHVRLIGFSEHGCPDTAYRDIRVYPNPVSAFSVSDSVGCGPLDVTFNNTSIPNDTGSIAIMSFSWNFGNGSTGIAVDPLVEFTSSKFGDTTYNIRLIANSEHGCRDTSYKTVRVHPRPLIGFTTDKNSGCGPFQVNFTNKTTLATAYHWLFGDGDSSSALNPSHTYQSYPMTDSIYPVTLHATSAFGCQSDTAFTNIIARYLPLASFMPSQDSICGSGGIIFLNTSVGGSANAWNFGNGSTSTSFNPGSTFTAAATTDTIYNVRLIVTSSFQCKDTAYYPVKVNFIPDASFASVTPGCTPLNVVFNNQSLRAVKYEWDFGDATSDSVQNPNKSFPNDLASDRKYLVTLKAISASGCQDTAKRTVLVFPNATARFNASTEDGCGPLKVNFTNTSTPNDTGKINIMTFAWNFANGANSTQQSPSATFVSNPTKDTVYHVRLIGFSEHGCPDTAYKDIRVYPKPLSRFTASDSVGCGPLDVSFTNTSLPYDTGSIAIMSFSWNFGNGFNGVAVDPVTQFIASNIGDTTYKVRLVGFSEHGCRDTSYKNITVHPRPLIGFTPDKTSGCGPLQVNFNNTTKLATSYSWFFGDGTTSSTKNPSHTYQSFPIYDSIYPVTLSATSAFGCQSDTAFTNIITRYQPVASFIPSADSICGTGSVIFFNTSVGGSTNSWKFGNGSTSTAFNPGSTFTAAATKDSIYTIRLVVTSSFQCRDTAYGPVKVNFIPSAAFASITPGCTPLAASFTNQSQRAAYYEWDFGDANQSTDINPNRTFVNDIALVNRVFPVTLKAYSSSGCMDTAKRNVTVFPRPLGGFSSSKTPRCDTAEFNFLNTTQGATTYLWDFGPGSNTATTSPKHSFASDPNGGDVTYMVKLISTSTNGCKDTSSGIITVKPLVIANFSSNMTASCSNLNVQFTNLSKNATSQFWIFGDGSGSPFVNPSHQYTTTGVYDVKLIAYDSYGCSDTAIKTSLISVYEVPTANFIYTPPIAAMPNSTVDFTDLSFSSEPLTYKWNFGDIASGVLNESVNPDPAHSYTDSGNFNVELIIKTIHNCYDTTYKTIRINPYPPVASFLYDPPQGCVPLTVHFTNKSTYSDKFYWDFGDATTSVEKDPTHTYTHPSKYNVYLRASGLGGVDDTIATEIITVHELPRAQFVANPINLILPDANLNLVDISLDAVKWNWSIFDDSREYYTSTDQNTSYSFQNDGQFSVRLIVENQYGCLDTTIKPRQVTVIRGGKILVANVFTPNGDHKNESFKPVFNGVQRDNYIFRIFNRWGQKVFETNNLEDAWDGTFSGQPAATDVYVWTVDGFFIGDISFSEKGTVTLLR